MTELILATSSLAPTGLTMYSTAPWRIPQICVRFLVLGRDHDDRDVRGSRILGELAGRLESVYAGHDHIHQDAVGPGGAGLPNAFLSAVGYQRLETALLQHVFEQVKLGWRIVDDQDYGHKRILS